MKPWFVKEAEAAGIPADEHYCMHMLEESNICWVPGTGFSSSDAWYFRTTFLPQTDDLREIILSGQ